MNVDMIDLKWDCGSADGRRMELSESRWIETEWPVPLSYVGSEVGEPGGMGRNLAFPSKPALNVPSGGGFHRSHPPDWNVDGSLFQIRFTQA